MKISIPKRRLRIIMFAMPDIAFLLLIFLILTVSAAEYDEVDVPRFAFAREAEFPEVVTLSIDDDGKIELFGATYETADLLGILGSVGRGVAIRVVADRRVPYLLVDSVLAALRRAGLQDVILIAEPDETL